MNWLLRMARWARHPPSPRMVKLVLLVVLIALCLAGIEQIWGWPEALTVHSNGRRMLRP